MLYKASQVVQPIVSVHINSGSCAVIVIFNQYSDMPHISDGWIILVTSMNFDTFKGKKLRNIIIHVCTE